MRSPAELVRSAGSLAILPAVYTRLSDAADDPRATADDIGRIIAEDVALTARLLRLVNSAAYGARPPVEDVARAVRLVGVAEMLEMALATTVIRSFGSPGWDGVDMRGFWFHGVSCGVAARTLVEGRGRRPDRLFTGGVLHDIGRLVLLLQEPERMRDAREQAAERRLALQQAERETFGFDHTDVGETLLRAWGLPDSLSAMCRWHHEPLAASSFRHEASAIHLADALVHGLGLGTSGQPLVPEVQPGVWDMLGFTTEDLPALRGEIERRSREVVQVLLPHGDARG